MMYEELNETLAAHDDSISFMAAIIMSCSEQTYMLLCFLGRDNKQYFKERGAKPGGRAIQWVSINTSGPDPGMFYLRPVAPVMSGGRRWLRFKVLGNGGSMERRRTNFYFLCLQQTNETTPNKWLLRSITACKAATLYK